MTACATMLLCNSIELPFDQAAILIGSQRASSAAVAHRLVESTSRGATVEQLQLLETKQCAGPCGEVKPLAEFSPHPTPRNTEQRRTKCKDCRAGGERANRAARPERHILTLMIQRCHNPNHPKYHYWGGRGIKVADEWRGPNGFELFFAHIGAKPTPKHEIDRFPNNDGNYEPGNVRWVTRKEQMLNTSRTVTITAFNKTLNLDEWEAETGIKRRTLEWRRDEGWTPEQILRTTLYKFNKKRGA